MTYCIYPSPSTADELKRLGHEYKSPYKIIRQRCLDCKQNSAEQVNGCQTVKCAAYPYRMGNNPFRTAPTYTPAERAARSKRMAYARKFRHAVEEEYDTDQE